MPSVSIPDEHLAAWGAILRAQASTVAAVEQALMEAGLPPLAWYDVLWPLRRVGRPMRMGELSTEVLTISRTGLTRLVDRIEDAGLLRRSAVAGDRRGVEVSITPEGVALLRRMWPVYAGVLRDRLVAAIPAAHAARVATMLEPLSGTETPPSPRPGRRARR